MYTEADLPPASATYLEDVFLKLVDQKAHDALVLLLQKRIDDLTAEQKTAWVRFLMSMIQRSPRTIADIKKRWEKQFLTIGPELEERYQRERKPDDPSTVREYLLRTPADAKARGIVNVLQAVMDLPNLGQHILNMRWGILECRSKRFSLFTSDHPIIRNNLRELDGHIAIPISPTKLFICANEIKLLHNLHASNPDNLIRRVNSLVVRQAEQLAYSIDDRALRFMENHFPAKP